MTSMQSTSSAPVCLCVHPKDPCLWLLQVRCCDQIGFLSKLSELLTGRGIDVDRAEISTIAGNIDNRFVLRASRASDIADADGWCNELEQTVLNHKSHGSVFTREPLPAACSRLAVNPDLLSVASFRLESMPSGAASPTNGLSSPNRSSSDLASLPGATGNQSYRYTLELKGINQAGLLAYASLLFLRSGFSIEHAQISTHDGHVADTFELVASSREAEFMLRSYLDIPMGMDKSPSMPWGRRRMWSDHSSKSDPEKSPAASEFGFPHDAEPPSIFPANGRANEYEVLTLSNGDVYEGELGLSQDGSRMRHGFGSYTYGKGQYMRYRGQWQNDKKHGYGVMLTRDGGAYAGQWRENSKHGLGVVFGASPDTPLQKWEMPVYRYEGEWQNDAQHGLGFEQSKSSAYFGEFAYGERFGNGLKLDLPSMQVADYTVMQGSECQSLLDVLEAEAGRSQSSSAHPYQALAGAYENIQANISANAQTYHFSNSDRSRTVPKLSADMFTPLPEMCGEEDLPNNSSQSTLATDLTAALAAQATPDSGGYTIAMEVSELSSSGDEHKARRHKSSPPLQSKASPIIGPIPDDTSPSQYTFTLEVSEMQSSDDSKQLQNQDAPKAGRLQLPVLPRKASPLLRPWKSPFSSPKMQLPSPGLDGQPRSSSKRLAAMLDSPRHAFSPQVSGTRSREGSSTQLCSPKRATTPESRANKGKAISCPMLWGRSELSVFMQCLGVNSNAVKKMRGYRCRGAAQIVQMADSEMKDELGLASPAERLVLRRALHRLLEADRAEASARGRTLRDVLNDPVLSTYIIPLEDLKFDQCISRGGFGKVYRGTLCPAANRGRLRAGQARAVAAKEMLGGYETRLYELLKEARVMASLHHPNICEFLGVCADAKPKGQRFLISALASCSLHDLVHLPERAPEAGNLTVKKAVCISRDICAGLAYIHDKNLVHADLKSANILIDISSKLRPKICDFGHAAVRAVPAPHHRLCTPHWAAPEVLRGESLGPAADVFSCGVIIWEMLTQELPHVGLGFAQIIVCVGWACTVPELSHLPDIPKLKSLLSACLHFSPAERPTAEHLHRQLSALLRSTRREGRALLETFLGDCFCGAQQLKS